MKTYYQYFHFMSCADSLVKALQNIRINNQVKRKVVQTSEKCYDAPNKYIGRIIDGMDQKKKNTSVTFCLYTKNLQEESFI